MNRNSAAARVRIPPDKQVAPLNKQFNRELTGFLMSDHDNSPRCLNLLIATRSSERIADPATSIAEEVVYRC